MIHQRPLKRHFKVHIDIQNETQPADLGDMHGVQAVIMICIMRALGTPAGSSKFNGKSTSQPSL